MSGAASTTAGPLLRMCEVMKRTRANMPTAQAVQANAHLRTRCREAVDELDNTLRALRALCVEVEQTRAAFAAVLPGERAEFQA